MYATQGMHIPVVVVASSQSSHHTHANMLLVINQHVTYCV